jgi:hypothetical protein
MGMAIRVSENLVREARARARVENRSLTGQIEYWAKIGKIAEENPDLSFNLLRELLIGIQQLDSEEDGEP